MKQFTEILESLNKICDNIVLDKNTNPDRLYYEIDQYEENNFKIELAIGLTSNKAVVSRVMALINIADYSFEISYCQSNEKFSICKIALLMNDDDLNMVNYQLDGFSKKSYKNIFKPKKRKLRWD